MRYPDEPVVGAETMHHVLRRWLADLGQDAYRDDAPPVGVTGEPLTATQDGRS
jgi:hypothetical protein